jgi:hypothetical protein
VFRVSFPALLDSNSSRTTCLRQFYGYKQHIQAKVATECPGQVESCDNNSSVGRSWVAQTTSNIYHLKLKTGNHNWKHTSRTDLRKTTAGVFQYIHGIQLIWKRCIVLWGGNDVLPLAWSAQGKTVESFASATSKGQRGVGATSDSFSTSHWLVANLNSPTTEFRIPVLTEEKASLRQDRLAYLDQ